MKAVFWHSDSKHPSGIPVDDDYRKMIEAFVLHLMEWDIEVVHLTTTGHRKYCDESYEYDLNPKYVVGNREEAFYDFLANKAKDGETYWFTEPDARIVKMFPRLIGDCAMLYREDKVPMCPAWRLATRKAVPLFKEFLDEMRKQERQDWHGDSDAFTTVYKRIGSHKSGYITLYKKVLIEFRDYEDYVKNRCTYTSNAMGFKRKRELMVGMK